MLLVLLVLVFAILAALKLFAKLTVGRCTSPVCLVGKTALVTGGNSGVGLHTAAALAGRGCRVIIADKDDCEKSKEKITSESGNPNIITKHLDLASLKSVRQLAKDINENEERLDILVHSAVACVGDAYTEDGLHNGMQINHFGPFLLTHLLLEKLKQSKPSRVLFLTTLDAYVCNMVPLDLNLPKGPNTLLSVLKVYVNSKLCNIVTANLFAAKLRGSGVTFNSVHPGLTDTPLFRTTIYGLVYSKWQKNILYFNYWCFLKPFGKTPEEGAEAVLQTAIDQDLERVSGKFFADCRTIPMPRLAKDAAFAKAIWRASEEFVKLTPAEKLSK